MAQPFILSVRIDTDDDATITFEGKNYCFYQDDLDISKPCDTVAAAITILRSIGCIERKRGLQAWYQGAIGKAVKNFEQGIHSYCQYGGNQEIEVFLRTNVEDKIAETSEVDLLKAEIERLKAENADLRETLMDYQETLTKVGKPRKAKACKQS